MTPLSRSQGFTDRLLCSHRTSRDPLHRGAWGPRQSGRHTVSQPLPTSTTLHPLPFLSLGSFIHSTHSHQPPHPTPNPLGSDSPYCTIPSFLLASSREKA